MSLATTIRVRYQETDAMGVVYYGNYLSWFEVARTEYMRRLGHTYAQLEVEGFFLPVIEASCRYKKPAHYDDELALYVLISVDGLKFRFDYEVRRVDNGELLAAGVTEHLCVNREGKIDRAASKRLASLVRSESSTLNTR